MDRDIIYYEQLDSTNRKIKELAEQDAREGLVVVADCQSAGRGRRGRSWESSETGNLYLSLLLRPGVAIEKAPMLTLVMAYSVASALREQYAVPAQIKWPNDIIVGTKKICGILTEMEVEDGRIRHVVIGVGINVNMQNIPESLKDKATSLFLETGKEHEREALLSTVLDDFEKQYERYSECQSLSYLQEAYNELLVNKDREVLVLDPAGEYTARALGINKDGELLVRKETGEQTAVFAGEVSVRGLYGYV